MSLYKIKIGR